MPHDDESDPSRHAEDGEAEPKKPSPLKTPIVRVALVIGAVAVLAAGAIWFQHYWTRGRFEQATDDAYLQSDQVTVSTRVSGFVDQVLVRDNQWVRAGDPLVKIDERDPRARLEQAQGQVAQSRAGIAQAKAQILQQQAQIAAGQAQLASATAQAGYADREVARYGPLAQSGAETGERLDQLRETSAQDRAQVAQQTAQVLAAQRQIASLKAQVLAGEAQEQQAQAQVRQALVDLDATNVRASIDGRIGDRTVRVGQYAQAGTPMMTVVPIQRLYVNANYKETQVGLMRTGEPATIKADALPGEALHGVVESFSPGTGSQFALIPPNNATGNFTKIVQRLPVRIRIDPGPEARKILTPGMSVTVVVDTRGARTDRRDLAEAQRDPRVGPGQ